MAFSVSATLTWRMPALLTTSGSVFLSSSSGGKATFTSRWLAYSIMVDQWVLIGAVLK